MSIGPNSDGKISRRQFVSGAAAGVAAVTAGSVLAGCSPKTAEETPAADAAATTDWRQKPDSIPDDKITNTVTTDLVVVGAGTAGMFTALSAAEKGLKVVLIAKDPEVSARGGSCFAMNSRLCKKYNISYDLDTVMQTITHIYSKRVDERAWSLFLQRSGEAMDWAMDIAEAAGLTPVLQNAEDIADNPIVGEYMGTHLFCGGPNGQLISEHPQKDLLLAMLDKGQAMGIDFRFNVKAEQLIREGDDTGRVTGLIASEEDGAYTKYIGTKGVVLGTGDYGANEAMMNEYQPALKGVTNIFTPVGSNSGDGQRMAVWAGAAMQRCQSHAAAVWGLTGAMETPSAEEMVGKEYLTEALFCLTMRYWVLAVDRNGERYENEHCGMGWQAQQILLQPGRTVFNIYDSKLPDWWDEVPGRLGGQVATHDDYRFYMCYGKGYDTLEAYAEAYNLPKDAFVATVKRYNEMCEAGEDTDFHKPPYALHSIDTPPYYGGPGGVYLLIPLGGLHVNHHMQVMDEDDNVIPGLYAVGATAGDFFANLYTTIMPGCNLGRTMTFGYLTGQYIAENE